MYNKKLFQILSSAFKQDYALFFQKARHQVNVKGFNLLICSQTVQLCSPSSGEGVLLLCEVVFILIHTLLIIHGMWWERNYRKTSNIL